MMTTARPPDRPATRWRPPAAPPRLAALRIAILTLAAFVPAGSIHAQWLYATATSLESDGTFITPRDVVTDPGAGALVTTAIPELPKTAGLAAVHVEGDAILFTPTLAIELPGSVFATRQDVVRREAGVFTIEIAGAAIGVPEESAIDALARDGGGSWLLSFDRTTDVGGLVVGDEDLVSFDGAVFSLFFDGSTESVPAEIDLDGADYRVAEDALLLSFDRAGRIDGVDFGREDLLRFDRDAASWSLELDATTRDPAFAATDLVAVPEPAFGLTTLLGAAGLLAAASRRDRSVR